MVSEVMRLRSLLLLVSFGCAPTETKVGSARLAMADATFDAAEGPIIEVGKTKVPEKLSGPVRIAADREAPYSEVIAAAKAVKAAGGKPVLLVARHDFVEALPDPAPPDDKPAIKLTATVGDTKACIYAPDNPEPTCAKRLDQKRIDRAWVRKLLYQALSEWTLTHVNVVIDPALPWGDAVRAIDGARTCCGEKYPVVIHVEPTY